MKKRVLIIDENASVPEDLRVMLEATALHANGYDVTVVCPRVDKDTPLPFEILDGIRIYRHPMPKERGGVLGYLLEYSAALFWEFIYASWVYLKHGFDVVQGCNPPDDIFLVALPFKLLGVRYIFDHHDVVPELCVAKDMKKGFLYACQCWLEKLTFFFSDVVMSTNGSYRDIAISRGGMDPADVFIVRNGPDLDRVKSVPANAALKYGKKFLVGYVGWMDVQEGIDILLDVAVQIKNQGRRDVHFTCVGVGPSVPQLRQMVQDKGLGEMFNFTGRVSDAELMEILSTADVCVNPDRPCPMNDMSTMVKIMEYMALGKPIVQFDVKEGKVSAGESSLYVSKDDYINDFAAKILWLLDRPEERARMGEFGRQRVLNELAWKYSVPKLLAAYERALLKGKRGAKVEPVAVRADEA